MDRSRLELLLCDLLSYAVREPALAAREIAVRYADVTSLAAADYNELCAIEHVGASGAHLLRLAFALRSRRITDKFPMGRRFNEEEFCEYLTALFFDSTNEEAYAFFVDDRGRVAFFDHLGEGTVNAMSVLPRKILELSVRHGCRRVIIAHNHPAGRAIASDEDLAATEQISRTLFDTQRELLAHYVVAGTEIYKIT